MRNRVSLAMVDETGGDLGESKWDGNENGRDRRRLTCPPFKSRISRVSSPGCVLHC